MKWLALLGVLCLVGCYWTNEHTYEFEVTAAGNWVLSGSIVGDQNVVWIKFGSGNQRFDSPTGWLESVDLYLDNGVLKLLEDGDVVAVSDEGHLRWP